MLLLLNILGAFNTIIYTKLNKVIKQLKALALSL